MTKIHLKIKKYRDYKSVNQYYNPYIYYYTFKVLVYQ